MAVVDWRTNKDQIDQRGFIEGGFEWWVEFAWEKTFQKNLNNGYSFWIHNMSFSDFMLEKAENNVNI